MAVSFNGATKVIACTTATSFSFHDDIYAPAIDWACVSGNMQYLIAVQGVGHAPISSGVYTDAIFSLVNGWTLQFNGYSAGDIITITGTVTNGQTSIIAPSSGSSPIVSFAGYTNATIVAAGGLVATAQDVRDAMALSTSATITSGSIDGNLRNISNGVNALQ